VSEKKPGRAAKICDKSRNEQMIAPTKFQPNQTIGSLSYSLKIPGQNTGKRAT
jgi:hypothetical protein